MSDLQTNQATDQHLIEAAAIGKADAIREIVERHQAMVYRTCLRILRNEADAEDAAQATFIVLHKKCQKLKPGTVLGGWLYRTAELVCREFIRSSGRHKHHEQELIAMNEATARDHTEIWNSLQPELDLAMTALPEKYRDVVVLRYLEGKSTSETATMMGLSDSTVTTRLARAMEQLRVTFQRRGVALSAGVLGVVIANHATAATVPATLTTNALAATGSGAAIAATSTKSGLMANAALAKMGSLVWYLANFLFFALWIDSMMSWVRGGYKIPRWVHIFAACLFAAGVASVVALGVLGMLTLKLAALCIVTPPAAAYIGWLWMYGPDFAKSDK